jgi:hypothetical protein
MRLQSLVIAGFFGMAAMASAKADSFAFTYTQGNQDGFYLSVSGTLSAQATAIPGQYTITNATGTDVLSIGGTPIETETITGVPSPDTAYGADDVLYTSGLVPYLDQYGFTFTTDGGGADFQGDVNIAYLSSELIYTTPYEGPAQNGAFTVSSALTGVPEPASITLVVGSLALGLVLRKAHGRT